MLAEELSQRSCVVVATSTKMLAPDWCPVLLDASLEQVKGTLDKTPLVCVGTLHEPTGKLDAPHSAFSDLAGMADYVLVEADGAKRLPLKAHASHEPVIPDCARATICVAGIDGVGLPISQTCHRPQRYAQLAGASADDVVTPEMVALVMEAEGLHDMVLINKVETPEQWQMAQAIAQSCTTPVVAGSLWREEYRCLR